MSSIMEALAGQLSGDAVGRISRELGVDENQASSAISGALPMLFGALAKNSESSEGLGALAGALDRDHDGSVLDDLAGFLGNSGAAESTGSAILGHVLGGRQANVQNSVSRTSGLNSQSTARLLSMLAPLVLGALGKQRRQGGLDNNGLAALLGGEQQRVVKQQPKMGLLGSLLDRDGDGDMMDDVAKAGVGLLGSILSKR